MADQLVSSPTQRGTIRRTLRSGSQSPARQHRNGDDLLTRLSPTSAFEALRSPSGALKKCMDRASASEQTFALKTAIASKRIHEWLDELSDWPWPSSGGSAGFEMPPAKRRKLSETETPEDNRQGKLPELATQQDTEYLGSLPADDVARYEKRIEQIYRDMDELDLEDIKSQVLLNHIMPLSRPGTPFSDCGLSVGSAFSYSKMEDLTAVVTAITVRALPYMSRLAKLLNTWSVRLVVIHKVPPLLTMIEDAEVALRSGWSAIEAAGRSPTNFKRDDESTDEEPSGLSRKDFDVIKLVLQQKVTKPGRDLDYMLDALEGLMDTLPDEWLDRMETIERDYAEWVTTAERQVRDGELSNLSRSVRSDRSPVEPETPQPKIHVQAPSPTKERPVPFDSNQSDSPGTPFGHSSASSDDSEVQETPSRAPPVEEPNGSFAPGPVRVLFDEPSKDIRGSTSQVMDLSEHAAHQHDVDLGTVAKNPSLDYDSADEERPRIFVSGSPSRSPRLSPPTQSRDQPYEGSEDVDSNDSDQSSPVLGELDRNVVRARASESAKHDEVMLHPALEDDFEPSILESVNEEDEEPELPPPRFEPRRGSRASTASTVLYEPSSNFLEPSDNPPLEEELAEPELPRLPDPDEPFSSGAPSPPSSPPLRYKPRATSVTFKEAPEVAPLPVAGGTPPRSPLMPPVVLDPETSFDWDSQIGCPSRGSTMSVTSEDDHMQRQLSDLLETLPAKIQLKRSKINLNPPDFQPPSRPKPQTTEPSRRSRSSLSSRAGTPSYSRSGTPSFMLAPARTPGPRSKSSQGIRLYHLSRAGGEPPIKLFIRCVGESNERVMVRVGGGWADLGEYLRDYAAHHTRRSKGEGKVEVTDSASTSRVGSSPASRPSSAMDRPITPLTIRKTRRSLGQEGSTVPKMPLVASQDDDTPSPGRRSRASSHVDWDEEDSALGLAGPNAAKRSDLSEESRAWVNSVKEKVRIASGERVIPPPPDQREPRRQKSNSSFSEMGKRVSPPHAEQKRPRRQASNSSFGETSRRVHPPPAEQREPRRQSSNSSFGEMGKVGTTTRLFRKN